MCTRDYLVMGFQFYHYKVIGETEYPYHYGKYTYINEYESGNSDFIFISVNNDVKVLFD